MIILANLKKYVDRFHAHHGIRTELLISDGIGENTFDPEGKVQLLRVIQEALTNSRKHSGAKTLNICVELIREQALITISDDGNGFDAGKLNRFDGSHFGLIFMQERMEQIGGSLIIESVQGAGTVLTLNVPIREQGEKSV